MLKGWWFILWTPSSKRESLYRSFVIVHWEIHTRKWNSVNNQVCDTSFLPSIPPPLHQATVCEIGKDVFMNISTLHVSEKKGFHILFLPSGLEEVSIQEWRKRSTYTKYMLARCLLSIFYSIFRNLNTDLLKRNSQKDKKRHNMRMRRKNLLSRSEFYTTSSLLFSFKNASVPLPLQQETWWLSQHHSWVIA